MFELACRALVHDALADRIELRRDGANQIHEIAAAQVATMLLERYGPGRGEAIERDDGEDQHRTLLQVTCAWHASEIGHTDVVELLGDRLGLGTELVAQLGVKEGWRALGLVRRIVHDKQVQTVVGLHSILQHDVQAVRRETVFQGACPIASTVAHVDLGNVGKHAAGVLECKMSESTM